MDTSGKLSGIHTGRSEKRHKNLFKPTPRRKRREITVLLNAIFRKLFNRLFVQVVHLCSFASSILCLRPTSHERTRRTFGKTLLRPGHSSDYDMATLGISRFPCREFCVHALVLRLRRFNELLAISQIAILSSPSDHKVDNLILVISELNSQACTPPVNASLHPYGMPTHDSGPQMVASLYRVGTFTLYSLPAFTGAFCPTRHSV
jgi:hypothetical protein